VCQLQYTRSKIKVARHQSHPDNEACLAYKSTYGSRWAHSGLAMMLGMMV